jgi:tetratricopeptide (TPR) repeat protein
MNRSARVLLTFASILLTIALCQGKDQWVRVRSKNFVLVGSASEKTIRDVAVKLEQFRSGIRAILVADLVDSPTPTTVIIFKDDKAYEPFKPLYQGRTSDVAGYFQKGEDMNYITMSTSFSAANRYSIIYHEFGHQLIHSVSDSFPVWFDEGLAEYYSTFEITNDGKKIWLGRAEADHVRLLRTTALLPLRLMFMTERNSRLYNETELKGVFYAQSWAFVHYCLLGKDRQHRPHLIRFLKLADEGTQDLDEQFRESFQMDYKTMTKELQSYLRHSKFPAEVLELRDRLEYEKEMTTEPVSDSEVAFYLGDLLLHCNRQREAESYLRQALSFDSNSSSARASLGMLRLRQNRLPEARGELEKAISADKVSPIVHYYYAYLLSRSDGSSQMALTHLKKCIQEMPAFAEAYNLLAFLNLVNNEDLDESIKLIRQGMRLAPGRKGFWLTLAQLQLRKGDYEAARRTIDTLRQGRCDESIREVADRVAMQMEQTERFGQRERIRGAQESGPGREAETAANKNPEVAKTAQALPDRQDASGQNEPEQPAGQENPGATPPSPPPPAKTQLKSTIMRARPACSPTFADLRGLSQASGVLVRVDPVGNEAAAFVVLIGPEEFQFLGPKAGTDLLFSCKTRLGNSVDYAKLPKSVVVIYFIPDDDSPRFAGTAIAIEL